MKFWNHLFLIISALILVLLDVSFFSSFQFHEAFFFSTFVILVIFSVVDKKQSYLFFACCLIFFLVALSSLQPAMLIISFLMLPMTLNWLRKRFFPEPTVITSTLYVMVSTLIFNLVAIILGGNFTTESLVALFYFVLLNTLLGFVFYLIYRRVFKRAIGEDIKI